MSGLYANVASMTNDGSTTYTPISLNHVLSAGKLKTMSAISTNSIICIFFTYKKG